MEVLGTEAIAFGALLAPVLQGRWWFCKHEAIQSLPDCAMFVRYVRDWVATRHPSWSGERQRDPEEDKEPENEAAEAQLHSIWGFSRACLLLGPSYTPAL